MDFEWDEAKRLANARKHGVEFSSVERFDWTSALTREDNRAEYGERRFVSAGLLDGRLHVAVWAARGERARLISLRKANKREVTLYEES